MHDRYLLEWSNHSCLITQNRPNQHTSVSQHVYTLPPYWSALLKPKASGASDTSEAALTMYTAPPESSAALAWKVICPLNCSLEPSA
jgi:hypothetical protein